MVRFLTWTWFGLLVGALIATLAKFQASTLERATAFEVGKVTFQAFSHAEWGLCIALIAAAFVARRRGAFGRLGWLLTAVIVAMVALQGAWVLPVLYHRVDLLMAGEPLPPSSLHRVYSVLELVKVVSLLWLGALSQPRTLSNQR